jgi:hypothetical protein
MCGHQRHDNDRKILETVVESPPRRPRPEQSRSQPGNLGGAGADPGKTELTQSIPDFPYHKYAELL